MMPGTGWARQARHWLTRSVRHKLLAMALGPLVVVFPLLVAAISLWGNVAYDRLLITKVRSDLAVAHGYFDKVLNDVNLGTQAVGNSHRLLSALGAPGRHSWPAGTQARQLAPLLQTERERLDLDFLRLYALDGRPLDAVPALPHTDAAPAGTNSHMPDRVAQLRDHGHTAALLLLLGANELSALAPRLVSRTGIALLPTPNATPTERTREDRAMVGLRVMTVHNLQGQAVAVLVAGVLLNQNLDFIDHINRVVYPEGALPFGSQGTATLFLEDVRITTNVRLFQDQRAIGTRVSREVREAVLTQGHTWLDRAFVVNDWYVSAYQPLADAQGERIGMLYVGYLEQPFRLVRYAMLGVMALIFLMVMALASVLSVRWARSIFKPVERMNHVMQQVENGQASARVGQLAARDELGSLANHLDSLLDVVADKTAALERWGQQLDQRVTERTAELAASHESLRLAQQQLVKSEKLAVMGQLAASVAHEINNPIAVMQGNLDLMRDTLGPAADPVRAEMRLLDEQVERIRLIVQQLLQHARPEEYAGYVEALDVNQVLKDCQVLVNHRLHSAGIRVVLDEGATRAAPFNRQELQQVLINLLINACNAMPQGGVLTLRTRDCPHGQEESGGFGGGVTIEVQDTGPGLAPETLERLFQPFFTTHSDGHGLGLWISLSLVERYGGDIRARHAVPGPGAVFTVYLRADL